MTAVREFQYVDERTLRGADDVEYDVIDAVAQLPWVRQLCPFMPHEYAILAKGPEQAWFVLESMIRLSPNSYRAFFRGYQSANRYWEAPDGFRYWRGRFEIDRWHASDTSGLRRRDAGAQAKKAWNGPRWAPEDSDYYVPGPGGKWWPSERFFADGYEPCRACRKPPAGFPRAPDSTEDEENRDRSDIHGA